MSAIVPLVIVGVTPNPVHAAWVGAVLIAMTAGARFAWVMGSAKRRLFEMTTWLYIYVFLGLAPIVQLRLGVDPGTTPGLFHEYDSVAIAIVLIGAVGLMIGSMLGKHRPTLRVTRSQPRVLTSARVNILAVVALALAAFYINQVGVAALFGSREALSELRSDVFARLGTIIPVSTVVNMTLLISALAQLQRRREQAALGERKPFILLGITLATLLVCVNPISTSRYVFGTVFLAVLAGLGIYGTIRRFRIVAASSILGFLFLFPILDAFRRSLDARIAVQNPIDSLVSGDFDSFGQINNTVLYVAENGPTWGYQALGVPLFWVPRELWPDKPVDTGILLAQSREYGFQNLSAPLWAELFINGGWVALILGMLLLGYWLRRADDYTEGILATASVPPILACVLPFYLLIMLRGSLLQSMANFSVLLVTWFLVTKRPKGAAWRAPGAALVPESTLATSVLRRG